MAEPLVVRAPQTAKSFLNKWATLAPELPARGFDPATIRSVMAIDQDLTRRGQVPMSGKDTALALLAARSGQAITPPPEPKGLLARIGADARQIIPGLIKLPANLIREAAQAPSVPGKVVEALQAPGGAGEKLEALSDVPIVRMLPGAYVAGRIGAGEAGELAEHPLFTALDILPYASRAARSAPRVKADRAARLAADKMPTSPLRSLVSQYTPEQIKTPFTDFVQRTFTGPGDVAARVAQARREALEGTAENPGMRQWASEVREMADDAGIDRDKIGELTHIATRGDPEQMEKLLPHEKSYVEKYREAGERLGVTDELYYYKGEFWPLTKEQGKVFRSGEKTLASKQIAEQLPKWQALRPQQVERVAAARDAAAQFDPEYPATVVDGLRGEMTDIALRSSAELGPYKAIRGIVTNKGGPIAAAIRALSKKDESGNPRPPNAKEYEYAAKAMDRAAKAMREKSLVENDTPIQLAERYEGIAQKLRFQKERLKQINALKRYERDLGKTDEQIRKAEELKAAAEARMAEAYIKNPPARFLPLVDEKTQEALKVLATQRLKERGANEAAISVVLDQIDQGLAGSLSTPLFSPKEIRAIKSEIAQSWTELKEAGYNPVFVHSVDFSQIAPMRFGNIFPDKIRTPSQFKERTANTKASIPNMEIALEHQGWELIRHRLVQDVAQWAQDTYAVTRQDLMRRYGSEWQAHIRSGESPRNLIERMMRQDDWVEWNPKALFAFTRPRTSFTGARSTEPMFIPGWLQRTLESMYPKHKGLFIRGVEQANNVFRTSVLPLSIRWHVNNLISGTLMLGSKADIGVFGDIGKAFKMAKASRDHLHGDALPIEVSRGVGSLSAEDAAWSWGAGETLGKWWKQTNAGKGIITFRDRFGKVVEKSFRLNEFVDTFYRSLAMMSGERQALRAGLSEGAARMEGIRMANRVLQDWDRMVPFERSIVRQTFPFYGWMKHIMSFTLSLPVDHPLRVSIVSSFARAELEDFGSGYPERLRSMLFLGRPDEYGRVLSVNLRGTNPFSDVANYLTVGGFVNQLNPVAGGLMEHLGINPATGKADLYPDLDYDPTTGRLIPQTRPLFQSIITNVLPLSELALSTTRFGKTAEEMRQLKLNNPDAYQARVLSSFGIPFAPRRINKAKEAAMAEVARDRAAHEALLRGLKLGDWGDAMRYPSNRPLLAQIAAVSENEMSPYALRPSTP